MQALAGGRDQLERGDVVARQYQLAGEPAHAATQRQAADAGMRDVPGGRGQAVRLGGAIEIPEQRAALDVRAALGGIDANCAHRAEVDHQAPIRHREADDAVTAALHGDLEAGEAGVAERRGNILRRGAPRDEIRASVDHGVPDLAMLVEGRVAGANELSGESGNRRRCHALSSAGLPNRRPKCSPFIGGRVHPLCRWSLRGSIGHFLADLDRSWENRPSPRPLPGRSWFSRGTNGHFLADIPSS